MKTGGRTPLGVAMNKIASKTVGIDSEAVSIVYGRIVERVIEEVVEDGKKTEKKVSGYRYKVRLSQPGSHGLIEMELTNPPGFLSGNYGEEDRLVEEKHPVRIQYYGGSPSNGTMELISDPFINRQTKEELAAQANDSPLQGTAFAPPPGVLG